MCTRFLGDTIDIHGGGNDLVFPHHENEILQSEAANGKPLSLFWVHHGMLQVQGAKMAKSAGNFFSVREVLKSYSKEEIRFYFLSAHYRGPQVYSPAALDEAAASLRRLHNTYAELLEAKGAAQGSEDAAELASRFRTAFVEAMDLDLNSRAAISALFDLVREVNKLLADGALSSQGVENILSALGDMDEVFGILPATFVPSSDRSGEFIDLLIEVRNDLRAKKQYELADKVRDGLKARGIEIQDTTDGVKWKRTT